MVWSPGSVEVYFNMLVIIGSRFYWFDVLFKLHIGALLVVALAPRVVTTQAPVSLGSTDDKEKVHARPRSG